MVISELVERMNCIKDKYGDCRVFVLSKSLYEGGTIIDAKDLALTSFMVEKKIPGTDEIQQVPEIIVMVSNCPLVANVEGTEEDEERLLYGPAIKSEEPEETTKSTSKRLFISVEGFILSYLQKTSNYYVDYTDVDEFDSFIKEKISSGVFSTYEEITTDLNHDAFVRVSKCLPVIFDLVGDRMYVRSNDDFEDYIGNYWDLADPDTIVSSLVSEFVQNKTKENKK